MNPCPCGEGGRPGGCECGEAQVAKYSGRVSGPLLDRFDLRVRVDRPVVDDLLSGDRGESSAVVAERVATARARAIARQGVVNAGLSAADLDVMAPLSPDALTVLRDQMERGRLSGRGYHRIRRVARTIADLGVEATPVIDEPTDRTRARAAHRCASDRRIEGRSMMSAASVPTWRHWPGSTT